MDEKKDWMLYRGDGEVRPLKLPSAPPWRDFQNAAEHRGKTYRPTEEDIRMVNIALHLRRPLLIEGPPGSGKSSLAHGVACELDIEPVLMWPVNSRSTLREGLYNYDAVGRLHDLGVSRDDAHHEDLIEKYLTLGPLGTALLPSERVRVLLIDEIDKSDGDLPNDLLHVLEYGWFRIPELERISSEKRKITVPPAVGKTGTTAVVTALPDGIVRATTFPFIVITTNGERELPPAFLRRCVRHRTEDFNTMQLQKIVESHLGTVVSTPSLGLVKQFLDQVQQGEQLAVDQLLNAVFLLTGRREIPETEREEITKAILQDLRQG